MQTLGVLPKEKRERISYETLTLHVKLAGLFGLRHFQEELEGLALTYLDLPLIKIFEYHPCHYKSFKLNYFEELGVC